MNNLQSPQILSDLYRDLRDRKLLPLVVVLIVGMVVVPIALSKSPEAAPPAAAPAPAPVAAKSNAPSQPVVISEPGLRDYKRRLSGDSPKDPFIQQFLPTAGPAESSDAGGASAGTESAGAGTGTTTSTDTSSGSTAPAPSSGGTTGGGQTQGKYYRYQVKARAGQLDGTPLKVYDSVRSLSPLPGKKVPVVQFLGVRTDSAFNPQHATFLVSPAVSSVNGEGTCTFAGTACQLLSLKPGEHEDFVWTDGLTYRIDLVKFNLTSIDQLPSTGKSKDTSGSGGRSPRKQEKTSSFYFSF